MKFLVIRFSSIGDIVLASPVLRCLKKQVMTAEVHFLTKSSFKAVTIANPYIDNFFYYEDDINTTIDLLKKEEYDYVIDLQNNLRSNKMKRALGVKSYTIDKLSFQKFLLTKLSIDIMPGRHITKRSLDTVAQFGVIDDEGGLDYFIPEADRVKESDIPASHHAGYIAIVIGASYYTKKLPVHKLIALCSGINHPVMLIGGKEDAEAGEQVAASSQGKVYNACGKFNLNESADLVRRSKLVISHDTGLQYIAAAFNKNVLAIWGSTSPRLDVVPYYSKSFVSGLKELPYENIIRQPELKCQPCSRYGNKKCPLGHFKCMEQMDIQYIIQRVEYRLGR
ncbi:MAG TPA: glycosyltransferase family 9 protein [Flavitalea sp.]|nr:glycosyltransferase family 9 protein [Flavitalea sp.]